MRLRRIGALTPATLAWLRTLRAHAAAHPAGDSIEAPAQPGRMLVILSGAASQQFQLPDGRRQIARMLIAGDFVEAGVAPLLDHAGILALTPTVAAHVTVHKDPVLASSLDRLVREDSKTIANQILRLGRLSARERMAHFLLELHERSALVGLVRDGPCPMPISQEVLADVVGLSIVHVNRVLQSLRREKLLTLRAGGLQLLQPTALKRLAMYDSVAQPLRACA